MSSPFYSQNLFAIGLDKVVTCFSLPFEPRAFALVYKKDSAGGYCCACLMLNNALTSLSVRKNLINQSHDSVL